DLLDVAVSRGVVDKSGAHLTFDGEHVGHGREKAREALLVNTAMSTALRSAVIAAAPERTSRVAMATRAEA
ncbi:MAG: hypothetical protein ABW133_26225, partial [Polyangiaceae bacterium]